MTLTSKGSLWTVLVATLGLLWVLTPTEKKIPSSFKTQSQPQEYMTQVSVWNFNEEGKLKHFLSAESWSYLPADESSLLTTPHLTVYKPDNSVWKIDAKQGVVTQPNIGTIDQVELQDSVVLQRPAAPSLDPILIETQKICYKPKENKAETDQFITLTKPELKITGVGMRALLDTNSVELLNNVKTHYVPNEISRH